MTRPEKSKRPAGGKSALYVDGERLSGRMAEQKLNERQLAKKAGVAPQTIRNFIASSAESPWCASLETLEKVCEALGNCPEQLLLSSDKVASWHERAASARKRFLADSLTVRSIAGTWRAESEDLTIDGHVSYQGAIAWHGTFTIEQSGNRFVARGEDKDDDEIFADGVLLEDGNWLRFEYWIGNDRLRQYGTGLLEHRGCGRVLTGTLIGRDAGHSNLGHVVAKLTLTRTAENGKG